MHSYLISYICDMGGVSLVQKELCFVEAEISLMQIYSHFMCF